MMMPMDLDPTNQHDLYERACRRMAELVPGWSDDIPSEPTVAILELASQLSNMQNHKWDLVGPEHYLAYLKLLGGVRKTQTPARLLASPLGEASCYPGQRYWVDGVPYEVAEGRRADGEIRSARAERGSRSTSWEPGVPLLLEGEDIKLYLAFTAALPARTAIRIWCGLAPRPGLVPPEADTPPPVALRGQIPNGEGWRDIPLTDGTCGLLRSGYLTITADLPFTSLRIELRGRLEGAPRIQQLVLEPVRLEQRLTRSAVMDLPPPYQLPEGWAGNRVLRCFLPAGPGGWREAPALSIHDGRVAGWTGAAPTAIRVIAAEPDFAFEFPLQPIACEEVLLEEEGILPESLRLMVREDGIWYDCPIAAPDPCQTLTRGCRWDETRRALCFGDGRDYRVPAGGAVLITACAITLGSGGNGAAGILRQGDVALLALAPAAGGRDGETAKDAFYRAAKEQAKPLRAVTPEDYELLARQTPGLALGPVHAISGQAMGRRNAGVTVLARPLSQDPLPVLTPWQRDRLREWLERYRMIGVPVSVRDPSYFPLGVEISLRVSEPIDEQAVRAAVLELTDGVVGPLSFGAEISATALTASLGGLEHVISVTALELRPLAGGARRGQDGAIRLRPDMLPYLKELRIKQLSSHATGLFGGSWT